MRWEEIQHFHDARDPELLTFDTDAVLERVEQEGDLFAAAESIKQELPKL